MAGLAWACQGEEASFQGWHQMMGGHVETVRVCAWDSMLGQWSSGEAVDQCQESWGWRVGYWLRPGVERAEGMADASAASFDAP